MVNCSICKNAMISDTWGELKCKLPGHEQNIDAYKRGKLRTCKQYRKDTTKK